MVAAPVSKKRMTARRLDRVGSGDAELMVRERQGASHGGGGHSRKEEVRFNGKKLYRIRILYNIV
jgi:hypothetical protein